ncbi:chorismate synthase [Mycobacterium tuberculosis CAS/NITR204]|uniref:chorismate synthase n=1 Tax=Mycobacterium tuberculosis CAS/NITR204 TaxID=1310114 RepID=R4MJ69_MYCTX|nr:chorismate synthase [Mycobacterium tuberculosis CAS/NITR204]
MTFERDAVTVLSGIRHGSTLGGPIAIEIGNTEWPKWETVMAADPVDPAELADVARNAPLTRPRPGHADYAGMLKYGFDDARPVLERASARETAARVAAGTVARAFLRQALGVEVLSHVISIGASAPYEGPPPRAEDLPAIDASPVRAYDKAAEADMIAQIEAAKKDGDTLGGVVEAVALGLPVGLGSFTSGDHRLAPAGRRRHGHPVDQGRGDRRRIPDRAPPRQPRPRRDVPRARRRRPLHQPGRGAGRRDDQRAAAAGACGDEADLGAARAGHRRPGDRR